MPLKYWYGNMYCHLSTFYKDNNWNELTRKLKDTYKGSINNIFKSIDMKYRHMYCLLFHLSLCTVILYFHLMFYWDISSNIILISNLYVWTQGKSIYDLDHVRYTQIIISNTQQWVSMGYKTLYQTITCSNSCKALSKCYLVV